MIVKTEEKYESFVTILSHRVYFDIVYEIRYNQTTINIYYDKGWYENYDLAFWTYKWYKDRKELHDLIMSELINFNRDWIIIPMKHLEFNLIYND